MAQLFKQGRVKAMCAKGIAECTKACDVGHGLGDLRPVKVRAKADVIFA
jgi:hypothetical protein